MASRSIKDMVDRKMLQIDVTFGTYLFSPIEKFAYYSIAFLLFGLTSIAIILYLPHHISILAGRAWYYINGETIDVAASARDVFGGALGNGKNAAAAVREL
ncbi:hypothetical protein BBK36DRAFT_1167279 [Trichoderma citrinoviride]|uniref:Uncharacterized protein n=1 Tax=Trichoderma citrinoviride TaxID=58853 RepID=A0A2T4BF65_9HYPO|nr:hypothetical protein BBK36DRAFT_1167279 [Trichoderma citrinoviride]PTB67980.1 hypothetical protein BBK36DRAFT_1167279 [Trichoderma citrinoviride]